MMKRTFVFLWLIILIAACTPAPTFPAVEQINIKWLEADLGEVGMDPDLLNEVIEKIQNGAV
jgi:hypothetical protein